MQPPFLLNFREVLCAFRVSAAAFRYGRVRVLDTKSTEAMPGSERSVGRRDPAERPRALGPGRGVVRGLVVPSRGGRRAAGAGGGEMPGGVSSKQQRRKTVGGSASPAATRVRLDLRLSRFQERLSVR